MAIQPGSELLHVEGADFAGTIPRGIHFISVFSCAVVRGGKQVEESKRLIAFLQSDTATKVMINSGMEPLASKWNFQARISFPMVDTIPASL